MLIVVCETCNTHLSHLSMFNLANRWSFSFFVLSSKHQESCILSSEKKKTLWFGWLRHPVISLHPQRPSYMLASNSFIKKSSSVKLIADCWSVGCGVVFSLFCVTGWQIDAHQAPLAAMVFSLNGLYLATASEKGTMIRVHLVAQATKVKLYLSPSESIWHWALYNSPYIFLHFSFNSHIVFGEEHTHQRSIHWHLVHLLIYLTFLLPQVHQALCTCFSLMLLGTQGSCPALC